MNFRELSALVTFRKVGRVRSLVLVLCGMLMGVSSADQDQHSDDELWDLAREAYQQGYAETGHLRLRTLLERNTGDIDLAVRCLSEILKQARQHDAHRLAQLPHLTFVDNPSAEHAARQLFAFERLGKVSAHHPAVNGAFTVLVDHHIRHGRLFQAREMTDRYVKANPNDPFWRIQQALVYKRLGSSNTQTLITALGEEMDLDHPDPGLRRQWIGFKTDLERQGGSIPKPILPVPDGSPLFMMDLDDPDGGWATILNRPVTTIPNVIDRVAARSVSLNQPLIWQDKSGITDPARALDLHLLSQPATNLKALRRLQAQRVGLERLGPNPSEDKVLNLYRRFPWATLAQMRLQYLANQMLLAGRPHSALRSFRDLLDHATLGRLRDVAQVGAWTALSQIDASLTAEELLGEVDPAKEFKWLGKPTPGKVICEQLIAARPSTVKSVSAVTLKELTQELVHLPPVAPWEGGLPSQIDLTVLSDGLLVSGRNLLALYRSDQPNEPVWTCLQPGFIGDVKKGPTLGGGHPGFFRPQVFEDQLFTRWGFSSQVPCGIASVDRTTGALHWSSDRRSQDSSPRLVPLSDPVPADGALIYLQWSSQGDLNQGRGRRLELVCFDPHTRKPRWEYPIALGGHSSDLTASLEQAQPASVIYGNRVTIHDGAAYSSSNSGIVARSDIRDGRTDWIFHYDPAPAAERNVRNHGAAPLVTGKHVICMPRDARRIFALDRRTGRLAWENPMALGEQLLGISDDLLIVLGRANLSALDLETGKAKWYWPLEEVVVGRASLQGSSIHLAGIRDLLRIDAVTGELQERRPWGLSGERPRAFAIDGKTLFVVTDKPALSESRPLLASATVDQPESPVPLSQNWSLRRDNAKVVLPPPGSGLKGTAFVISEGILERVELAAPGRVLWQRFIEGGSSTIRFSGNTMMVIDFAHGRAPGLVNQVLAFDATNGESLWEQEIDAPVSSTLTCGGTQVFHNATGRIVAVDIATGERAWERNLGEGFQMRLAWDDAHLHIFFVSKLRAAAHLVVDAASGHTVRDSAIAAKTSEDARNAKIVKGGYYEVTFESKAARFVKLVALSEVNGRGWASISELQVMDAGGSNYPRKGWAATASNSETKARYNTAPQCVIDDDPVTWWHSQWIDGIPPHPHSVTIDMGKRQPVSGIRYLPAVIVNNNGMIREYALYLSDDGKNWGKAAAEGFMVNRTRVDSAFATEKSIVFQSRAAPNQPLNVYRYPLDGSPALLVRRNSAVHYMKEPYYISSEGKDLNVFRFDDPNYSFKLGSSEHFDLGSIELENDRLILGRKGFLVADLAQRRFVVAPSDPGQTLNKEGVILRAGGDDLIKIVPQGTEGQMIYRFNLKTGQRTEGLLKGHLAQFQSVQQDQGGGIPEFTGGVIMLNDGEALTAWMAPTP